MNYLFFRHGRVGIPEAPEMVEGVHRKIYKENLDRFFSSEGFFYPLSGTGPSPVAVIREQVNPKIFAKLSTTPSYIMIDRWGFIHQFDIIKTAQEEGYMFDLHEMPNSDDMVWVAGKNCAARQAFTGALVAFTSEEKFQADTDAMLLAENRKIHWFTMDEIKAKLQALYDKEQEANAKDSSEGNASTT